MKNIRRAFFLIAFLGLIFWVGPLNAHAQNIDLLTPEEVLWLKSRNNTIVIYPEKNFPPFSYQSTSGAPNGLSIDYIELIADKIGAKVTYLQSRPISQILDDVRSGKGDVITSVADTQDREDYLLFTDNYINVPAIIVARKDSELKSATPADLAGKKVAVAEKHAVEEYLRKNYPRIVIEGVTDDEIGLQKVVLGEVDAAVMDVATLSFYLSKQALNSVKVVGNTGFEYKLAFATQKNKPILQSILDKGLTQISVSDRQLLADKWINLSNTKSEDSLAAKVQSILGTPLLYTLFIIGFIGIIVAIARRRPRYSFRFNRKTRAIEDLQEKLEELQESDNVLAEELGQIKDLEKKISSKIEEIQK